MINKAVQFIEELKPHTPNIFWSNINQAVTIVSALIVSIIFTRLGNEELYGQYLFVLAVFGLFSIVSIPGVKSVILRTTAQGHDGVYRKATTFSFFWSLPGVLFLVITGIFFYLFKTKILGIILIAFAFFFPLVTSLQNWMFYLKGRSEFWKLALYNFIKLLVGLIAITLSIVFTGNLVIILLAYFLVDGGLNVLYHIKSLGLLRNEELDAGWKKQSYALTIMNLSSIIFGRVDLVMIGSFLTFKELAIYGLVMKFADAFFQLIRGTIEAVLPNLFQSKKITIRYFYGYFLLSFLIPLILYPIVKYPILLMYGPEYSQVIVLSQVYLAIIPFYFLNAIATCFMVKYQLNAEINISRMASMIILIVLYAILIPLYGIWGGVISSMLYFIIELLLNLSFLKIRGTKHYPIGQLKETI